MAIKMIKTPALLVETKFHHFTSAPGYVIHLYFLWQFCCYIFVTCLFYTLLINLNLNVLFHLKAVDTIGNYSK